MGYPILDNKDRLISIGPCELESITLAAVTGAGYITIYDGINDNQNSVMVISSGNTFSFSPFFLKPLKFKKGIYITVSTSNVFYTVVISEKESESEEK